MELPERKRNRLPRYDYSAAGAYFITICVHEKKNRLFQRSFHDHVIRGEKDYAMIWKYIDNNPASWADDCFFVAEPQR